MEDAATTPIEPAPLLEPPKLTPTFFTPAVRAILTVFFLLAGLFCAASAIIIALTTVYLIPTFILYSIDHPYVALLGTIVFLGSALLFSILCAFGFNFTRYLFKKESIPRQSLLLCAICFILTLVFQFGLLPLLGSTFTV